MGVLFRMPGTEGISALSAGVDIQSDEECRVSLESFGQRYIRALFSDEERNHSAFSATPRWIAGRFAAKEAIFKILHSTADQAIPWTDIRVLSADGGWLTVDLQGAARTAAAARGLAQISVSISHSSGFSCAVAVSHGDKPPGPEPADAAQSRPPGHGPTEET